MIPILLQKNLIINPIECFSLLFELMFMLNFEVEIIS